MKHGTLLKSLAMATAAAPWVAQPAEEAPRPNILFIMTDQQRYDEMSCNSGQAITPNFDRLAARGVNFGRFFVHAPSCVSSRSCLFTGRHAVARGYEGRFWVSLESSEVHLFKALKQAGYHLGYVGKNHLLKVPELKNFDFTAMEDDERKLPERQEYAALKKQQSALLREKGSWASSLFYDLDPKSSDTWYRREQAIKYLQTAPADQPFCLTVSISDPHVPHLAPAKFKEWYPLDRVKMPSFPPDVLDGKEPRYKIKQAAQMVNAATDEDRRRYLAVRWAMVSWVDENVGAILDALDATGRRQDTIIVFTSDGGDFAWHYGMVKKDLVLPDALMHVPFMVAWDGHIQPGAVDNTIVEQIDVMPTLLDLCGVPAPTGCQGKSVAPVLRREQTAHKDIAFFEECRPGMRNPYRTYAEFRRDWDEYHNKPGHKLTYTASFNIPGDFTRAVRTMDWKYIWYENGFEELYDLRSDPQEFVNLALNPEHRAKCAEMKAQLDRYAQDAADPRSADERARDAAKYDRWE